VRERTAASSHKHAYSHQGKPYEASIKRSEEHISFLNGQIGQTEKAITDTVACDEPLRSGLKYVRSIPGAGLLTAVTVVAETNGFASVTGIKQLSSYAGPDIKIEESGTWKGQSKISKNGNSHIRKALYMPTVYRITHDAVTVEFYEQLKAKKGTGMTANVAAQRKLLGLIYTLWKKQEMYDPDCGENKKQGKSPAADSHSVCSEAAESRTGCENAETEPSVAVPAACSAAAAEGGIKETVTEKNHGRDIPAVGKKAKKSPDTDGKKTASKVTPAVRKRRGRSVKTVAGEAVSGPDEPGRETASRNSGDL
jgi:hypothetical protein